MSKTKYIITLTLWILLVIVILVFFTLALSINKIFFVFFAVFVLLEILLIKHMPINLLKMLLPMKLRKVKNLKKISKKLWMH